MQLFIGLSETAEGALIVAVASLLTLLLSQVWNYVLAMGERKARLNERQAELNARSQEQEAERAEWYRRTLFERRLQAVTEAYGRALQMHELINRFRHKPGAREDKELVTELLEASKEAREWYYANAVYLNDDLPQSSNFIYVVYSASHIMYDDTFEERTFSELLKELQSRTQDLLRSIRDPA